MAIQIRRGTNANWEANNSNIVAGEPAITTDSERFLVGTSSGAFAEFPNIDELVDPYDITANYVIGQNVNYKGQIYTCLANTSGSWNSANWNAVTLSDAMLSYSNYLELASLLADTFDNTATYFEGQFAIYGNNVYLAKQDITTAESWNAAHWSLIGAKS